MDKKGKKRREIDKNRYEIDKINAKINTLLNKGEEILYIKRYELNIAKQLIKIRGIDTSKIRIKII